MITKIGSAGHCCPHWFAGSQASEVLPLRRMLSAQYFAANSGLSLGLLSGLYRARVAWPGIHPAVAVCYACLGVICLNVLSPVLGTFVIESACGLKIRTFLHHPTLGGNTTARANPSGKSCQKRDLWWAGDWWRCLVPTRRCMCALYRP